MHVELIERTLDYGTYYLGTLVKLARERQVDDQRNVAKQYGDAAETLRVIRRAFAKTAATAAKRAYIEAEVNKILDADQEVPELVQFAENLKVAIGD